MMTFLSFRVELVNAIESKKQEEEEKGKGRTSMTTGPLSSYFYYGGGLLRRCSACAWYCAAIPRAFTRYNVVGIEPSCH